MWGNTPLITACQYARQDIALFLLAQDDVNINILNEKNVSALLFSCLEGLIGVVEKLLSNKNLCLTMEPCVVYNQIVGKTSLQNPLSSSIINGHADIVSSLIKAIGETHVNLPFHFNCIKGVAVSGKMENFTPLMVAAAAGQVSVVERLLEYENINKMATDSEGNTFLHHSMVTKSAREIISVLQSRQKLERCLVQYKNTNGDTALHLACDLKRSDSIYILLAAGAIVNAQNGTGATALHNAIRKKDEKSVELLLQHGADSKIEDVMSITRYSHLNPHTISTVRD